MVSNARVMAEQARLALNDAYIAAHGPAHPIRQGVEPENVFSHPGLIREALETPGETVQVVTTGNLAVSTQLTPEGGTAVVSTATNTAEVVDKAPKGAELTDEQKTAQKDMKSSDAKKAMTVSVSGDDLPDATHR